MKLFKLKANSKNPDCEWKKKLNWHNKITGNYAVLTGKVNNIVAVDLDTYKWEKDHLFVKTFGENYIELFNTYTVKSVNGGYHLYFEYDVDIRTTQNSDFFIDIRNDGGYVVGSGSSIDNKYYTVIHGNKKKIKPMPLELKEWLITHIYKTTIEKVEKKRIKREARLAEIGSLYKYVVPKEDIDILMEELPGDYFSKFENWLKFTTVCKTLDMRDMWCKYSYIWDKYSEQYGSYHCKNNEDVWNLCINGTGHTLFESLLYDANLLDRLAYYRLKPVLSDTIKPKKYINFDKLGYNYLQPDKNFVIKSDTGTGKTTSVKHYIKNQKTNFISIVSRISLSQEQYKIFSDQGIDCCLYQLEPGLYQGQSVIIQLDSLKRIQKFDFSDYVVFMDEFNSIIEYLVTSPTLYNKRVPIFRLFLKILRTAKQIICVDADINDMCFTMLDHINLNYEYHINEHQHNKGIKATELEDKKNLIERLKKEDKFILACDSKTECKYIYNKLMKANPHKPIKLITSDLASTESIDMDKYDRIIFSPKIIYGLDSVMERPVYCLYKGSTILPTHMVQQINRCRNITNIYYLFLVRYADTATYVNLDDCKKLLNKETDHNLSGFKDMATDNESKLYLELLGFCEYNKDCYKTNKFLHFKEIIRSRGIIDDNLYYDRSFKKCASSHKILQEDLANFTLDNPKINEVNEFLQLPKDQIENYKEYFVSDQKLSNHFSISSYFFKELDEVIDSVKSVAEFKVKYITSNDSYIVFLKQLCDAVGLKIDTNGKLSLTKKLTKEQNEKFVADFITIFRNRNKKIKIDFMDESVLMNKLYIIFKNIFGDDIIDSKQQTKNKIRYYYLNNDRINKEKSLYLFRHPFITTCVLGDDIVKIKPNIKIKPKIVPKINKKA